MRQFHTEQKFNLNFAHLIFALSFIVPIYLRYSSVYIGKKIEISKGFCRVKNVGKHF